MVLPPSKMVLLPSKMVLPPSYMVLPQAMAWVQYWFRVLSLKFCGKSKKNCGDISPQSPAFCMYAINLSLLLTEFEMACIVNRLHSLAPFSPSCQGSCLATSKIDNLPRSVLITEPWTARARGQVVTRVEESCQSWLLVLVAFSALVSFKALNCNLSKVDNVSHSFRYLLGIVFFIPNTPCTMRTNVVVIKVFLKNANDWLLPRTELKLWLNFIIFVSRYICPVCAN